MSAMELVEKIVKILDSKKAHDIKVIGISDVSTISDYFVVAGGSSSTQVKALADEVEYKLKKEGIYPLRIEGYSSSQWVLVDYGHVVLHVFYNETREYYGLERLWVDGEQIDVSSMLISEDTDS